VLATKLYADMGPWPNEGKLSALNIRRASSYIERCRLPGLIAVPRAGAPHAA
jgi:hypothetical protein